MHFCQAGQCKLLLLMQQKEQIKLMRPKSAGLSNDRRSTSRKKPKYQTQNLSSSFASRKNNTKDWQYQIEDIKLCKNAKQIPLIHAYQPHRLKQCMVKNPKSYKKFYATYGSCSLSSLYTNSFVAHMKEWKKSIKYRLTNLLSMVLQSDSFENQSNEKNINLILEEIQSLIQELQQSVKVVKQNNKQAKGEWSSLERSFQMLEQYIVNVRLVIQELSIFNKQINKLIDEGASHKNSRDAQGKIRKIHRQTEKQIFKYIRYCSAHPQITLIKNVQYKIKLKFDNIVKEGLIILERIEKLQVLKKKFQKKLNQIQSTMAQEECSIKILQEIVELLMENEIGRGNLTQRVQYYGAIETLNKLQSDIIEEQNKFLLQFKYHSLTMIKRLYDETIQTMLYDSLMNHGKNYQLAYKKMILLSKVFTKKRLLEYHNLIETFLQNTSENFKKLLQFTEILISMSKDKKFQSKREIKKTLECLIHPIQIYEQNKQKIILQLMAILIESQFQIPRQSKSLKSFLKDSEKIKRLLLILDSSEVETEELLEKMISKTQYSQPKLSKMKELVKENNKKLKQFSEQELPIMLQHSFQLKSLIKDKLVEQLLLFEDDLNRQQIHGFVLIRDIYGAYYGQKKKRKINPQIAKQMASYYQSIILQCEEMKNREILEQFLTFIFINRISDYIISQSKEINEILTDPGNENYEKNPKKTSYRGSTEIRQKINGKNKMLQIFQQNIQQYRSLGPYCWFIQEQHKKIKKFIEDQELYHQFSCSGQNGCYYPSIESLNQWVSSQYSFHVDKTLNEQQIRIIRQHYGQMFNAYIEKLSLVSKNFGIEDFFVREVKHQITLINNLLYSSLSLNNYVELVGRVCTYLRDIKVQHMAICTADQRPITFLIDLGDYVTIIGYLEARLGLPDGTIERKSTIFQPIQADKMFASIIQSFSNKAISSSPSPKKIDSGKFFLLQGLTQNKTQKLDESQLQQDIILENDEIQEKNDKVEEVMGHFISTEQKKQKAPSIYSKQDTQPVYKYFCLNKFQNLQALIESLKFYQAERSMIKAKLKPEILLLVYQPIQPNTTLYSHLQTVLESSGGANILSLLNSVKKYSDTQLQVKQLKDALYGSDKLKREQCLSELLEHLGGSCEIQYEGGDDDKIVICNMGEGARYCHTILKHQTPFQHHSLMISIDRLKEIERQIWLSLLGEKNSRIDKVHCLIEHLNRDIKEKCNEVMRKLHVYKQFPIVDGGSIDQTVEDYIDKYVKPENQIRLMASIDIQCLYSLLAEIKCIPCLEKFKCSLVCGEQSIYKAETYEAIPQFISQTKLLPQAFITSQYVERRTVSQAIIKIQEIERELLTQLSNTKDITIQDVLSFIKSPKYLEEIQHRANQYDKCLTNKELTECEKLFRAVNRADKIQEKKGFIQKQKQVLQFLIESLSSVDLKEVNFIISKQQSRNGDEEEEESNDEENDLMVSSRKEKRVQHQHKFFNELSSKLKSANIPHRAIVYDEQIIGLSKNQDNLSEAVTRGLGINNTQGMGISLVDDKIVIENLKIWLSIGNISSYQSSLLVEAPKVYIIQVFNGKTWLSFKAEELLNKHVSIQCPYPKEPFVLKLDEQDKITYLSQNMYKNRLENYQYGEKYTLRKIYQIVKKNIDQLEEGVREKKRKEERAAKKEKERILRENGKNANSKQERMSKTRKQGDKSSNEDREKNRVRKKKAVTVSHELSKNNLHHKTELTEEQDLESKQQKFPESEVKYQKQKKEEKKEKSETQIFIMKQQERFNKQDRIIQQKMKNSEGCEPQKITFIEIDFSKIQQDNKSQDQISITLSDQANINRQNLIFENREYFEDVHQLIRKRKASLEKVRRGF